VGAAESALKRDFETKITNEYRIAISAQNTGSPFSYSKPESILAHEIVELAQAIDASFAPQVAATAGAGAQRAGAAKAR
jgi:MinD-like ATPase involved in chromosome partitioning or flagellar assembly